MKVELSTWLESLQDERKELLKKRDELDAELKELEAGIKFVAKQLKVQAGENDRHYVFDPDLTSRDKEMPDPSTAKGWRDFVRLGSAKGFKMRELGKVWKEYKSSPGDSDELPF